MATYIISSGRGNGFYTLREEWTEVRGEWVWEKSRHIATLARDWEKAVEKAKTYITKGDRLLGSKFDLNEWGEADIEKFVYEPSPEEVERRRLAKIEAEKREQEYQEQKAKEKAIWEKAEPVPVTDERVEFCGVIEKTYSKESEWGTQYRLFFVDDRGFKLNGGLGKAFDGLWNKEGTRVKFTAKVKPSDHDIKFGFYSRPTKVEVLD